jgi:serine/threonine protein kinase
MISIANFTTSKIVHQDNDLILYQAHKAGEENNKVLLITPTSIYPSSDTIKLLDHEYKLAYKLNSSFSVVPIEYSKSDGSNYLILENYNGECLESKLNNPFNLDQFFSEAIAITEAVSMMHTAGIIHRNIKPSNILINQSMNTIKLTGFGMASCLTKERQFFATEETIPGTLAYMAPEQTGRMNRSIDFRSDLYSLGIIFLALYGFRGLRLPTTEAMMVIVLFPAF